MVVVVCLIIVSSLAHILVRLVTRSTKSRFSQVDDQVGQGQGPELDNMKISVFGGFILVVFGDIWIFK